MLNQRSQSGFSLIEVMISILIFSLGILGMVGLQGSAVRFQDDARFRAEAAAAADEVIGLMWVDRSNLDSYLDEQKQIVALPQGMRTIERLDDGSDVSRNRLRVTVSWTPPGGETHRHVVVTEINTIGGSGS